MADVTKTSLPRAIQEHQDLSRRIAILAAASVLLVVLVELGVRVGFHGEETPAWVVPVRLIPWLLLFLSFMGWMIHSINKPIVRPALKKVSPRLPAESTKAKETPAAPDPVPPEGPTVPVRFRKPYLLPAEPMVGRVRERERLSNWYRSGTSGVLVLHSRGGFGKSALAWLWAHHDLMALTLPGQGPEKGLASQLAEQHRPKGVFWWSFEEAHAPFSAMLDELVDFLAGGREVSAAGGSRSAKIDFVVDELAQRSILVVLDGFEHNLDAYANTSAHYQSDRLSGATDLDQRRCADPWAAEFLFRMAAVREGGRVLVLTRHIPAEVETVPANSGSTFELAELTGLDPNECVSWMNSAGVKGERTRQLVLSRICNYRPLAIRVSIGMAMADPHTKGEVNSVIDNGQIAKNQNPHQVVRAAIGALSKPARELISRLSAIRGTVDRTTLESISNVGLGVKLDRVLDDLVERGLLLAAPDRQRFQLHGLVRSASYERLADPAAIHTQMETRWAALASYADPNLVAGLAPLVERFHHLTAAGSFDQARDFFRDYLAKWVLYKHGDFSLGAQLYRSLFPDGLSSPPMMDKGSSNAAAVRQMAEILLMQGQPSHAADVAQLAVDRSNAWRTRQTADVDLFLQGEASLRAGRLRQAFESIDLGVQLCHQSSEQLRWGMGRELLARLFLIQGMRGEAATEAETALQVAESWRQASDIAACLATLAEIRLAQDRLEEAAEFAERAVVVAQPTTVDLEAFPIAAIRAGKSIAKVLVARAEQASSSDESALLLKGALDHTNATLRILWRRNLVSFDPELRLVRASIYRARQQSDRAEKEGVVALRMAERTEGRLVQVDAHIMLAQLAGLRNEPDRQQIHLDRARELAWCDGSPHCYKSALETVIAR
jgi:tetratricopeptide (TPR) repeat protein